MKVKVAINGFGRIGRCIFRSFFENDRYNQHIELVAINELSDLPTMVHLARYDSTFGRFGSTIESYDDYMEIEGHKIKILHERSPERLPWRDLGIDVVLECTGSYKDRQTAQLHLESGAKKLIFSQPADSDIDATVVYGINHQLVQPEHTIISAASCTSNCIIPIIYILDKHLTVEAGAITTIHSAMLDQSILDSYNNDLRKTRSAMQSMIPVKTELNKGIERVLPRMRNKIETLAIRVPTTNVSLMDASLSVREETTTDDVNRLITRYAADSLKGILGHSDEELVSCDFIGDSRSSIVDVSQTRVGAGKLVKILTWFDNEWGYANRMLDTTLVATGRDDRNDRLVS